MTLHVSDAIHEFSCKPVQLYVIVLETYRQGREKYVKLYFGAIGSHSPLCL